MLFLFYCFVGGQLSVVQYPFRGGGIFFLLIELFSYKYEIIIQQLILPIIIRDLEYTLNNYRKVSFDIWEEKKGWHFYTRMVQTKFLKEAIHYKKLIQDKIDIELMNTTYQGLLNDLKDHVNGETIISSFDVNGKIIKYEDAANLLAFCHINYDEEILKTVPLEYINHTCDSLIQAFRKKYQDDEMNLIGRYIDDKYYNGHVWIICSLALGQIYIELYKRRNVVNYSSPMHRSKSNPNNLFIEIANGILERILTLDPNLILPEQFNPTTNEFLSAEKLTWNYSELYQLYNLLN